LENTLRIHGKLLKLGIQIAQFTMGLDGQRLLC
jgi:hypothetical protein